MHQGAQRNVPQQERSWKRRAESLVLIPARLDFRSWLARSLQHQIGQGPAPGCKTEIRLLELEEKEFSQPQVCRRRARGAQEAENSEVNPEKHLISFIHPDECSAGYQADAAAKNSLPLPRGLLGSPKSKLSSSFLANEQQERPGRLHTTIKLKEHLS